MLQKNPVHLAVVAALSTGLGTMTAYAGSVQMDPVPAPVTDDEKHQVLSSPNAKINGLWEETGFTTLLRSGQTLPLLVGTEASDSETERFGKLYMADGTALVDEGDGSCDENGLNCGDAISNSNDFNSFIEAGDNLYLVSHFETRPGAMYLTLLDQNDNGDLTPVATRLIDFSEVDGGWVHCAGTKTPWGTHLGSEEYEPDARTWVDPNLPISTYNAAMYGYFDADGWTFNNNNPAGDPAKAQEGMNPYAYGYPVEVAVNADGSTEVTKHYALGRSANELSIVLPDEKTVYITDDGTNTALLMFVADKAGDLSAGTLYAGVWNQTADTPEGGRARLSWINLGHTTAAAVEAAVDAEVTFDQLFDYESVPNPDDGTCPTLDSINSGHGGPYHECLRLKAQLPVDEAVAGRLEVRRYAALKGATTEFRKMEGASYDPSRRTLYMAMSDIGSGMTDGDPSRDLGGPNHIRLTANKCGAIYALRLGGRARDTDGNPIDSDYVARNMTGVLAGERVASSGDNQCSQDSIGNPDNITFLPRYNTLVIGEDAGNSVHQIDYIWSYDLRSEELTRVQTTPFGSETTSPYWYPNLSGYGYLMSVVQHPYGESDQDKLSTAPEGDAAKYGYVGYFKFPKLN